MGNVDSKFNNYYVFTDSSPVKASPNSSVTLREIAKKSPGTERFELSSFIYEYDSVSSTPSEKESMVVDTVKRMKTLKHPNLIKFIDIKYLAGNHACFITERAKFSSQAVEYLSLDELLLGYYEISEALNFLHSKCGICLRELNESHLLIGSNEFVSWKLGILNDCVTATESSIKKNWSRLCECLKRDFTKVIQDLNPRLHDEIRAAFETESIDTFEKIKYALDKSALVNAIKYFKSIRTLKAEEKLFLAQVISRKIDNMSLLGFQRIFLPYLLRDEILIEGETRSLFKSTFHVLSTKYEKESLLINNLILPAALKWLQSRNTQLWLNFIDSFESSIILFVKFISWEQLKVSVLSNLTEALEDEDLTIRNSSLSFLLKLLKFHIETSNPSIESLNFIIDNIFPLAPDITQVDDLVHLWCLCSESKTEYSIKLIEGYSMLISNLAENIKDQLITKLIEAEPKTRFQCTQLISLFTSILSEEDISICSEGIMELVKRLKTFCSNERKEPNDHKIMVSKPKRKIFTVKSNLLPRQVTENSDTGTAKESYRLQREEEANVVIEAKENTSSLKTGDDESTIESSKPTEKVGDWDFDDDDLW